MKKLVSTDFSAENWLILGKKWSMMIATADKYGCRTLPMRNWHPLAEENHYRSRSRRTLPMRNWHISFVPIFPFCRITCMSDITYEELTHQWCISYTFVPNMGSDITYEELTLTCWWGMCGIEKLTVGHYLWGIDTVINNNWHFISFFIFAILSDITYEELTLSVIMIVFCFSIHSSRTLPMRNWHRLRKSKG